MDNELLKKLTPKKRDFVLSYIKNKNATQAAKEAGYSEKTAYSQGQRLLKNVEIQEAMQSITEPIVKEQLIEIEDIIKELKDIGLADWREFITIRDRDGKVIATDLRLTDKLKALQLLGDHLGAWKDQTITLRHRTLTQAIDSAESD